MISFYEKTGTNSSKILIHIKAAFNCLLEFYQLQQEYPARSL